MAAAARQLLVQDREALAKDLHAADAVMQEALAPQALLTICDKLEPEKTKKVEAQREVVPVEALVLAEADKAEAEPEAVPVAAEAHESKSSSSELRLSSHSTKRGYSPPMLRRWLESRNSSGQDPEEFRATLVEHLDELRGRLVRSLIILISAWVIGYYIQPGIYDFLMEWGRRSVPKSVDYKEVFNSLTSPFMLKLKFGFFLGLILCAPFLATQIWGFVKPGLKPEERRAFRSIVPFSLILFSMGVGLCWMVLPMALSWFVSYATDFAGTSIYQEPGNLVFFIMKMLLAFGVAFQLPVIVFFLSRVGILTPELLMSSWRQATTGIFVISMFITPSNDALSMLMMAIPMTLLYVITIYVVKVTQPKAEREAILDQLE